jgi:hypothetical protein
MLLEYCREKAMKRLFLLAGIFAVACLSPTDAPAGNAQLLEQHLLLKNWPFSIPGKTVGGGTCFGSNPPLSPDLSRRALEKFVAEGFNPENISSPKTKLRYRLTVKKGFLTWEMISSENSDLADVFYCDQFLWELGVMPPSTADCQTEVVFSGDRNSWQNAEQDELKSPDRRTLLMHFVPLSVASRFNGFFSPSEDIQCRENVVALKIEKRKDRRYFNFLSDWDYFLGDHRFGSKQPATRDSIIAFAKGMRAKYADLFSG